MNTPLDTAPLSAIFAATRKCLENESWIDEITAPDEDGEPNDYARRVVSLDDALAALDRLEAADKRERATAEKSSAVGDNAAMRKALLIVKKLFDGQIMFQPAIREAHEAVNAALSKPPRNCDIYRTEAEAEAAFDRFCMKSRTGECKPRECPLRGNGGKYCYVAWLLGTEGGAGR